MQLSSVENGGYRGAGLKLLSDHDLSVGDKVRILTNDDEVSGVIMPRYESASEEYLSIKLKSGYNTGVKISNIKSNSSKTRFAQENQDKKRSITLLFFMIIFHKKNQ